MSAARQHVAQAQATASAQLDENCNYSNVDTELIEQPDDHGHVEGHDLPPTDEPNDYDHEGEFQGRGRDEMTDAVMAAAVAGPPRVFDLFLRRLPCVF